MIDDKKKYLECENIIEDNWITFRKSGLLFIVNQFLHIFGWSIVYEYFDENTDIDIYSPDRVFPARTKFRGFGDKQQERGYLNITNYMKSNADSLLEDLKAK